MHLNTNFIELDTQPNETNKNVIPMITPTLHNNYRLLRRFIICIENREFISILTYLYQFYQFNWVDDVSFKSTKEAIQLSLRRTFYNVWVTGLCKTKFKNKIDFLYNSEYPFVHKNVP